MNRHAMAAATPGHRPRAATPISGNPQSGLHLADAPPAVVADSLTVLVGPVIYAGGSRVFPQTGRWFTDAGAVEP
jgi:hypothetical protein